MLKKISISTFIALVILSLTSCSTSNHFFKKNTSKDSNIRSKQTTSDETLYHKALLKMQKGYYLEASIDLSNIVKNQPLGKLNELAKIQLAYLMIKLSQYENAKILINSIIELNPDHYNIDYIYYLRGITSLFETIDALPNIKYAQIHKVDLTGILEAQGHFSFFIQKFPNSIYANDALHRRLYCEHILAQSEIEIALFYVKKRSWLAAYNRAQKVLNAFPDTPLLSEALTIMWYTAKKMQLSTHASELNEILKLNYPNQPKINAKYFHQKEHILKKRIFLDKWIIKLTSPIKSFNEG